MFVLSTIRSKQVSQQAALPWGVHATREPLLLPVSRHRCFWHALPTFCRALLHGVLHQSDGALLLGVPAAPVRVPRRAPVALFPRLGGRPRAELLAHLAVLVPVAHPLLDVLVQLAPRDAALSAVHLAPGQHPVDRVLLALAVGDERPRQSPDPLHVVGAGPADGEGDGAAHAPVDVVEVSAGQAEARAVNVVEEVEDGKVQLRWQVEELELLAGSLQERQRHIVHDRVRSLGAGQLWPRRCRARDSVLYDRGRQACGVRCEG